MATARERRAFRKSRAPGIRCRSLTGASAGHKLLWGSQMTDAEYFSALVHFAIPLALCLWALALAYEGRWRDTAIGVGIGLVCLVSANWTPLIKARWRSTGRFAPYLVSRYRFAARAFAMASISLGPKGPCSATSLCASSGVMPCRCANCSIVRSTDQTAMPAGLPTLLRTAFSTTA